MRKTLFITFLTILLWSCKENKEDNFDVPTTVTAEIKEIPVEPQLAIVNVDQLRIRNLPDLSSSIIVELSEGDTLYYLNQRTLETTELILREQTINAPWLKVRTTNGLEGWVFGGGIRSEK